MRRGVFVPRGSIYASVRSQQNEMAEIRIKPLCSRFRDSMNRRSPLETAMQLYVPPTSGRVPFNLRKKK
jgi:hypothetical protein